MFSSVVIFHYNMNRDFEEFLKKDTKDSNLARMYVQNISKTNLLFPYFKEETLEILQKRKE